MKRSKKNRTIILTVGLTLSLLLAACGEKKTETVEVPVPSASAVPSPETAAETPAPANNTLPTLEEQKQILEANRELWAFDDPYASPWFYTFTDLDHNGRLEVIAASTQGTGIFTYAHFYEVRADGSGIDSCYEAPEGLNDWPEIILDTLPCYYDAAADRYYYVCEGVTRDGAAHQYYAWQALSLKDGVGTWERLADKKMEWRNGGETLDVTCVDAEGNPISEADYDRAVERRFAGMEESTLTLDWTQVEIPFGDPLAPVESAGPAIVITKNPSSEAITVGGKTWFIAHADNADRLTWLMLRPDGETYTLSDAMAANPGLKLEALEGDTIAVSNVPLSANGWGVLARFDGPGGDALTEPAYLYVGEFTAAYDSVISAYRAAYAGGNQGNLEYLSNHGLSEVAAYSSGVGYALKDLDKDGTPELIIAGMGTDDFSDGIVYGLYTLVDGAPVNLVTSWARNRYYLLTDNTVLSEGSGGAAYTYITLWRLTGDKLTETEMVFTDLDDSNQIVYYAQQGHSDGLPSEKSVAITQAQFDERWEQWEGKIYVPPLTKIF